MDSQKPIHINLVLISASTLHWQTIINHCITPIACRYTEAPLQHTSWCLVSEMLIGFCEMPVPLMVWFSTFGFKSIKRHFSKQCLHSGELRHKTPSINIKTWTIAWPLAKYFLSMKLELSKTQDRIFIIPYLNSKH